MSKKKLCTAPNQNAEPPAIDLQPGSAVLIGYQRYTLTQHTFEIQPDDYRLLGKYQILAFFMEPRFLKHRTVLDLGASGGFFSFVSLQNGAKSVIAMDMDEEYIDLIESAGEHLGFDTFEAVKVNVADWKQPADVVFALAVIHWLYSCTAVMGSLSKVIEHLSNLTDYLLLVEWIAPEDPLVQEFGHITWNQDYIKEPYTFENFEAALSEHFASFAKLSEITPTRHLYAAFRHKYPIYLSMPHPFIMDTKNIISCQHIAEHDGVQYWSCVYNDSERSVIIKQGTLDLASREYHFLSQFNSPYFPQVFDYEIRDDYSTVTLERIDGVMLNDAMDSVNRDFDTFYAFTQECLNILDMLQEKGIAHRDIRPANIMLRDGKPVLIDFGWAYSDDKPYWQPPELGGYERSPDGWLSDTFSFGKTFEEVNSGRFPELEAPISVMTASEASTRLTNAKDLKILFERTVNGKTGMYQSKTSPAENAATGTNREMLLDLLSSNQQRLVITQRLIKEKEQFIELIQAQTGERESVLKNQLAENNRIIEQQQENITQLESDIAGRVAELTRLQENHEAENQQHRVEVERLQNELTSLTAQLGEARTGNLHYESEIERVQARLHEESILHDAEIEALKAEYAEAQRQHQAASQSYQAALQHLQSQFANEITAHDRQNADFQNYIAELQEQLQHLTASYENQLIYQRAAAEAEQYTLTQKLREEHELDNWELSQRYEQRIAAIDAEKARDIIAIEGKLAELQIQFTAEERQIFRQHNSQLRAYEMELSREKKHSQETGAHVQAQYNQLRERLLALSQTQRELETALQRERDALFAIHATRSFRLLQRWWRIKNRVFPAGSRRLRMYELLRTSLGTLFKGGPFAFIKRLFLWLRGERRYYSRPGDSATIDIETTAPTILEPDIPILEIPVSPSDTQIENYLWLDLGCGKYKRDGYTGVDIEDLPDVDTVEDLNTTDWSFDDNSVGMISSSYTLHLLDDPLHFFGELYRIAVHNAIVEIVVPLNDRDGKTVFDEHWFDKNLDSARFIITDREIQEKSGFTPDGARHHWRELNVMLRINKLNIPTLIHSPVFKPDREQMKYIAPATRKRMHIVYIVPTYSIVGGHRVVFEHANGLAGRGHQVTVLRVLDELTDYSWFNFQHPVRFGKLDDFKDWHNVDCVVATYHMTVRYILDLPLTIKRFYLVQSEERRFYERIVRDYFECEETYRVPGINLLPIAKWLQQWLKEEFGRDSFYIPNRANPAHFYYEESELTQPDSRVILVEGNADAVKKGVQIAWEAIKKLDCQKWLLTNSPEPPEYTQGFDRVFSLPPQNMLHKIYSAADILIKPSFMEGSPLPHLEAMICRAALISTNATGVDEYCIDGYNSLIVPVGDVDAIRRAAQQLLEDDELRQILVENAALTAKTFTGWNPAIDILEEAFYAGKLPGDYLVSSEEFFREVDTRYGITLRSMGV